MTRKSDNLFDEIGNYLFSTLIEKKLLSEIGATIAKMQFEQKQKKFERNIPQITFRINNTKQFVPQHEWTPEKQFNEKVCKADGCYNTISIFKPNGKYCSPICRNKQSWKNSKTSILVKPEQK